MMDRVYRGKSIDGAGSPGEWYYGGIVHQTDYYGNAVDDYYIIDGTSTQDNRIGYETKVDPDTVGQFIGLDDKNGKPIFEDDIVKQTVQYPNSEHKVLIGVVKEDFCNPCFVIDDGKFPEFDFVKCGYAMLEVLGNIHDNPELLEELK